MGCGHCCLQWGGISNTCDVGGTETPQEMSMLRMPPSTFSKALGQICQGSATPAPALCACTPPRRPPAETRWWMEGAEQGEGWRRGISSPAANSRTIQGISPPAFGQEIWRRLGWPTARCQLLL